MRQTIVRVFLILAIALLSYSVGFSQDIPVDSTNAQSVITNEKPLKKAYELDEAQLEIERRDLRNELVNLNTVGSSNGIVFENYDEMSIRNIAEKDITEIRFLGEVKILMGNNTLKARLVIITMKSGQILDISAFERVEFQYEGAIYLADSLSFNPDTKKGILNNVRSYMANTAGSPIGTTGGFYYFAEKAMIYSESRLVMENISFTFTPSEYPHYQFFASKLWMFKGDVIFATHIEYKIGQQNFFYFPFFFQWEKFTGLQTAFGNERRIGYYLMNSFKIELEDLSFSLGLDIYERLGEYFYADIKNKKNFGPFSSFSLNLKLANDVRISYLNDRYIPMVPIENGIYTNIRQFAWSYKMNATVGTNDALININWEDLNDPFFANKYQQRKTTFDIKELIQPYDNTYYSVGRSDLTPNVSTINRSISIQYFNFNMNGNWSYNREIDPSISNVYLNDRYKFYLKNVAFPNISYNFGQVALITNMSDSMPHTITLHLSNSNIVLPLDANINRYIIVSTNIPYERRVSVTNVVEKKVKGRNKTKREMEIKTTTYKGVQTQFTNQYTISTNFFNFYSISSYINGTFNYSSSEVVDTNSNPISDFFSHRETGNLSLNSSFLNNLFVFNNNFSFVNEKYWSSFEADRVNNINRSGVTVGLNSSLTFSQTPILFQGMSYQVNLPMSFGHTMNMQLIRTTYSLAGNPLETSHNTSASAGFNMFSNNLSLNFSASHYIKSRQTNITNDNYLNDILDQSVSLATTLKVFWLNFSIPSVSMNILKTKTNENEDFWSFTNMTNRMSPRGNFPVTISFASPMNPIPNISYTYDLLMQTNKSFNINSRLNIGNIYNFLFLHRLEALNLDVSLYWDFLSPRSTIFSMNFGTTMWFDKNWKLTFSTGVKNSDIYRYFTNNTAYFSGTTPYKDFFLDLQNSFGFDKNWNWNFTNLYSGFFKIQAFHFDLVHYLNEWEMHLTFDVSRRLDYQKRVAYWEPTLRIEFMLSATKDQFPPYQKKFVPDQYQ